MTTFTTYPYSPAGRKGFISSIDLKNDFLQIPLVTDSREKTAFAISMRPLIEFKVI